MSTNSTTAKIAYMANQIARAFAAKGEKEQAAATATHINQFWEPRMREKLLALVADGDSSLDPVVIRAAKSVRSPAPSPA